jgi:hypothetical protein
MRSLALSIALIALLPVTPLFAAQAPPFSLTVSASNGGTVDPPAGKYQLIADESKPFTITPSIGFHIDRILMDGTAKTLSNPADAVTVTAPADFIANISGKHKLAVKFASNFYQVTTQVEGSGSIAPAALKVKHGTKKVFTVKPAKGYRIGSVTVNGVEQPDVPETGNYKLELPPITSETQIAAKFEPFPEFTGTWMLGTVFNPEALDLVSFANDSEYLHAKAGNAQGDPNCVEGISRGTYRFDQKNGVIKASSTVDTTQNCGFNGSVRIGFTDTGWYFYDPDNPNNTITMTRIAPVPTNPLSGSWGGLNEAGDFIVLTFIDDKNVVFSDGTKKPDTSKGEAVGVERGTYAWNQATGDFTVQLAVDTNGEAGLSHPKGPMTISVGNDTLTLTVQNEGVFTIPRLK